MSNKTHGEDVEKTALVHKKIAVPVIIGVVVLVLGVLAALLGNKENVAQKVDKSPTFCLEGQQKPVCDITLELADTQQKRMNGLSGREALATDKGMLFVFDFTGEQCFWMKDMRFSIDMVFINEAKRIVKIDKAVSPETYPQNFCSKDVRYVIELPSGKSDQVGLAAGAQLAF